MGGVEREEFLVRSNSIQLGIGGRIGGVYGVLLRDTREPGDYGSGQVLTGNFFHEQWMGRSLPLNHFWVKAVKKGINRANEEGKNQQRARMPLSRYGRGRPRSGEWAGEKRG